MDKNLTSSFKIGGILAKKIFLNFLETSVIISSWAVNSRYEVKKFKKLFLWEKNPTSIFKIGGILTKKIFRKFLETSVMISLERGDSRYFGQKITKTFRSGQKSNFNFQNRGYFG